jgi:uncharacterized SAM-binding protein YcdF (DUF218 family)
MIGEFKPLLTALALPPASLLLLITLGAWMAGMGWRVGRVFMAIGLISLWALSTPATVAPLAQHLLNLPPPLSASALQSGNWQAIVVLGGGIEAEAPEWASAQVNAQTARRVRYGVHLSKLSGLPMAFSGGVGWSQFGRAVPTEAAVAQTYALEAGASFTWLEAQSRDTQQNAAFTRRVLQPAGIQRIVLVTHAWHLPRAAAEFEQAGFAVLPAPTGYPGLNQVSALAWLPSADALQSNAQLLREGLGLLVMRIR